MDELIPKWLSNDMIELARKLETKEITEAQYIEMMIQTLHLRRLQLRSQPGNPDHGK